MEASSSNFSPESWTLLPRREWLQDSALRHQNFRSPRVYIQCDLSCTKGLMHWEQLLWQLPRPGNSTDAVNTVPAPYLWCWQQDQTTKPTQCHTWLGLLTWHLFPSTFLCFSEAMWMHHRASSQIKWKSKGKRGSSCKRSYCCHPFARVKPQQQTSRKQE